MIRLEGVSKAYRTKEGKKHILRDVTAEFPNGVNVGILGRNGAGKSTLLRIMGGIEAPDSGRVVTDKRISWPLGLSGGFQGSMTGRENVKFVCRIYGASLRQIRLKVAFVKEFSELAAYFDMPVKTYSSGMRSRLAFALSMAFDFDIYLIDEITSVGDKDFKVKCRQALKEKWQQSNILMVSHDMRSLRDFCDMGVLLEDGRMKIFTDLEEAIVKYETL